MAITLYETVLTGLKKEVPTLKIKEKSTSFLCKVVYFAGFLFLINKEFLTSKTIFTLGTTIYVTGASTFGSSYKDLLVLEHEAQHMKDYKKLGWLLYTAMYLFPQCLALFSLLAFWKLPFLGCLIFLAPWPAPFRLWIERRGYERELRCLIIYSYPKPSVTLVNTTINSYVRSLTSSVYYFCSWSPKSLRSYFKHVTSTLW